MKANVSFAETRPLLEHACEVLVNQSDPTKCDRSSWDEESNDSLLEVLHVRASLN